MKPLEVLAERHARERRVRERNELVRQAIGAGAAPGYVMLEFGLSRTAYEQLAGQVRSR